MNQNPSKEMTNAEIYQSILNIRNLKPEVRLASLQLIQTVFKSLGPERSTTEYLPYLLNTPCYTEKDWALILDNISKIDISQFQISEIRRLLNEIKFLSELDSKVVRNAFSNCIGSFAKLNNDDINDKLIPEFVDELLKTEWDLSQMAALSIIPKILYHISYNITKQLLKSALSLCESETSLVRYSFVKMSSEIVGMLNEPEAIQLFESILTLLDDFSISILCEISTFFINYVQRLQEKYKDTIEPLHKLLKHSSWRVRCTTINSLKSIFQNVKVTFDEFYQFLQIGASDNEDEVRMAACQQLPFVSKMRNIDTNKMKEMIEKFSKDTNQHCRTTIASSLPLFSNSLGFDFVTSHLLDLIPDPSREVKLAAIESLKSKEIARETALECIITLIKSQHKYLWREKQKIIEIILTVIKPQDNSKDIYKSFTQLTSLLLNDGAYDVRVSMVENLPYLKKNLGDDWFKNDVVPIIKKAADDEDYKIRQTAVRAVISCELFNPNGFEILYNAAKDNVSNVRLVVAKYTPRNYQNILSPLKDDPDEDVAELAKQLDIS